MNLKSQLLNIKATAETLDISTNAARALFDKALIAHARYGRRRYTSRQHLRLFLATPSNRLRLPYHAEYNDRERQAVTLGAYRLSQIPPAEATKEHWANLLGILAAQPYEDADARHLLGIPFLELKGIQRVSGVGRSTVLRALTHGQVAGVKLAGSWLASPLWVEDWCTTSTGGPVVDNTPDGLARRRRQNAMRDPVNREERTLPRGDKLPPEPW